MTTNPKKYPTATARGRVKKAQTEQAKARSYTTDTGAQGGVGSGKLDANPSSPRESFTKAQRDALYAAAQKAGIPSNKVSKMLGRQRAQNFLKSIEMRQNSDQRRKR